MKTAADFNLLIAQFKADIDETTSTILSKPAKIRKGLQMLVVYCPTPAINIITRFRC